MRSWWFPWCETNQGQRKLRETADVITYNDSRCWILTNNSVQSVDSVVKLWIQKYTEIGPVLEVKTFYHLDKHGIEIQIPFTSGDNTDVWVVISRGSNRNVDELRHKDPEYSPESRCRTTEYAIEISMQFI